VWDFVVPTTPMSFGRVGGHENVRVFNSNTLLGFGRAHANANNAVRELNRSLRDATWTKMADVVTSYPSATALNGERVVFKIKGNNYRSIVAFDFLRQAAFIKFIGSHTEYDRVNALTVDLFGKK
jgi:mRNA interferase HigB